MKRQDFLLENFKKCCLFKAEIKEKLNNWVFNSIIIEECFKMEKKDENVY